MARGYFFDVFTIPKEQIAFPSAPTVRLPFTATSITIANDSDDSEIHYSFDGSNLGGILRNTDGPLVMDGLAESQLWFKQPNPNNDENITIRVWGWRGGAGR